ncbi:MAG TPA: YggS family pyridoxal phosphate-dependent enzyme [Gammaproteobacteria bacterium]|nr:YggS family pyridoxal phosphate-dependent enzyme [Gammaproteobacteria bacterium]
MTEITEHLAEIVERVARAAQRARTTNGVTIVAVSKEQPASAIREAFLAGQTHFGESYVQEASGKMAELEALGITWHFVGRLQTNKTRAVAEAFHWVHTVDRDKIARRLSEQRPPHAPPLNVLIQVNQAGEPQKAGVAPHDVAALARAILSMPRLALRGLMTIPPAEDARGAAHWFAELAALRRSLAADGIELDTLSMGMSADCETAIAAGASCVRIGTAIFGARP